MSARSADGAVMGRVQRLSSSGRQRRGQVGFSLIEVLITVVVVGAITIVLMLFFLQTSKRARDDVSNSAVGKTTLNRFLKRDVPSASGVAYPFDTSVVGATFTSCADLTHLNRNA